MPLIRLQDNTPDTYCNRSRDFQLFLRLYDCVINGVKNDIDSITDIIDTHLCRAEILSLLQTKLGFFTTKYINDTELRLILEAFPIIVKNKGSLLSILQAVNVFLKAKNIKSETTIYYTLKDSYIEGNTNYKVNGHSVVIGIQDSLKDTTILYEIFRYILPVGVDYYIYFYTSSVNNTILFTEDEAKLLFVTNNINSQLRSTDEDYELEIDNETTLYASRTIGSIDASEIMSYDSSMPYHNNIMVYRGKFSSTSDVLNPTQDDICLAGTDNNLLEYRYNGSSWDVLNFKGIKLRTTTGYTPTTGDIVGEQITLNTDGSCYIIDSTNNINHFGKFNTTQPVSPVDYDAWLDTTTNSYKYYYNNTTYSIELFGSYTQYSTEFKSNGLYMITGIRYYYYNGSNWIDNTYAIYQLRYAKGE